MFSMGHRIIFLCLPDDRFSRFCPFLFISCFCFCVVVVVHKDLAAAAAADVSVLPAAGAAAAPPTATLLRLLAAGNNATARFGVSFAGQTFDGSTDGLPLGERVAESVPLVGGRYAFSLPPRSAAILEIALAKGAENL